MHPDNAKNCIAPEPQLRDSVGGLADLLVHADNLAEVIEDKLFGVNQGSCVDAPCPPSTVQSCINRSMNAVQRLVDRLNSINSRL